jgi:hypothetical protein
MKYRLLLIALVGVLFIVSGCAYYSLVESGRKVEVDQGLWVESEIPWNKAKQRGAVIWTVDGPNLQQLIFFPGIKEGKPLLKPVTGQDSDKMPTYMAGMTFIEIIDLLEATLARENVHQFEKQNIVSVTVGGEDGFRFDFSYVSEEGLNYNGIAAGAVRDDKLYLVMYIGTTLHYFEKYIEEVDYILKSIEFL